MHDGLMAGTNEFDWGLLMKILLAADGSAFSVRAVEYLVTHLNFFQGAPELHALHVTPQIPFAHARASVGPEVLEDYYREMSTAALSPVEDVLEKNNLPYTAGYKVGDVAAEIQAYAKDNAIDLIVMGSHGHRALLNLILGSVANKVLAMTSIPVLIIR